MVGIIGISIFWCANISELLENYDDEGFPFPGNPNQYFCYAGAYIVGDQKILLTMIG